MKTIRILSVAFPLALLLSLTGCNKNDQSVSPTPTVTADEYQSPDYQMTDLNQLEVPAITTGTDVEFQATDAADKNDPEHPCMGNNNDPNGLGAILRKLNLSAEQKSAIKGYLADHKGCVVNHIKKVIEIHKAIMQKYNAAREELVKSYKTGNITKEQFTAKMTELRGRLIAEIRNHQIRQLELRAAHQCREELLKKIASVLTEEQRAKFIEWVKSH